MKNGRKEGDRMEHFFVLPFYGPVAGFRNAPPGLHRSVVGSVAARAITALNPRIYDGMTRPASKAPAA